jgi:hypothetical protein
MNEKVKLQNLGLAILVGILASALIVNAGYIGDPATTHYHGQFSQFPHSYIIEPFNSTFYQSVNSTGWVYQDSNASKVFNFALLNLSTAATGCIGSVFVKSGTYNIDTEIVIGQKTYFIADAGVTLNVTRDLSYGCIALWTNNVFYEDYKIQNFQINMNNFTGDGIYASNAAGFGGMSEISNLNIRNVKYGYWGMYLGNPFSMKMSQIDIYSNGSGIAFPQIKEADTGNSIFEDVYVELGHNDTMGIWFNSSAAKSPIILSTWTRLQVISTSYRVVDVYINGSGLGLDMDFFCIDLEGRTDAGSGCKGMVIDSASGINIYGNHAGVTNGIVINGTSTSILISGLTHKAYQDLTSGLSNITITGGYVWGSITATPSTHWLDVKGYTTVSYGNQTECVNGTQIKHGLVHTPTSITLTMYGKNFINNTCWYLPPTVYSLDSTYITICFTLFNAGTITAVGLPDNRTVYWHAVYQP